MVDRKGLGKAGWDGDISGIKPHRSKKQRLCGALPLVPLFKGSASGEGRMPNQTRTLGGYIYLEVRIARFI